MDKKNNQVLSRIIIAFVVWCLAYWGSTLLCDKVLDNVEGIECVNIFDRETSEILSEEYPQVVFR